MKADLLDDLFKSIVEAGTIISEIRQQESEWEICRVCGGEMDAHAPCLTFPSSKGVVEFQHMKCPSQESEGVVLEIAHDPRFKDIGVLTLYKDGLIAWIEPGTYRLTRIEDDPDQEVWDYLDKGGI